MVIHPREGSCSAGAAIGQTPFAPGFATDAAGDRVAFTEARDDEPWIGVADPGGTHHFLVRGDSAVFTPGRTALLSARRINEPTELRSELNLYHLADGRTRRLAVLPNGFHLEDMRFSSDGRSIWLLGPDTLREYRVAAGRIVRTIPLRMSDVNLCRDFEMLPSGLRMVLSCPFERGTLDGQLHVVNLATGTVTGPIRLPAGQVVETIHGRLNATELLVGGSRDGFDGYWLGALDVRTMTVRQLPGAAGLRAAVAPY